MTELINRYKNGKVYKIEPICDHDEEDIYIGSTCKHYLSSRMNQHRNSYKINKNLCNVILLFDKYGVENCNIILLEEVKANNKMELHQREAHYIKTLPCVNKYIPLRTKKEYTKEYKEINKDEIKKKNKEYKEINKEQIKEKNKQYREANKDKYKIWCINNNNILKEQRKEKYINNKEQIKENREANKDKINAKNREKYEANKDAINARRRELRLLKIKQ